MNVVFSRRGLACLALVLVLAISALLATTFDDPGEPKIKLSKLEVIALLQARRFGELEDFFLQFGKVEQPVDYLWGLSAFEHSDPVNQGHLDAWVAARPDSFVARMARGTYSFHLGGVVRGTGTLMVTSRQQLLGMRPYLLSAVEDFEQALDLNPRILSNYEKLIRIGMMLGWHDLSDRTYRRARSVFPDSPRLAETYLFALQLKWRGDRETFFGYWRHLKDHHGADARYAFLDHYATGNADYPAERLERERKYEELLAYHEARLAKTESAADRRGRATALEYLERRDEAEAELRRAMALAPYWDVLYKDLSRVHYWQNEMEAAKAAVDSFVARDPFNPERLSYRAGLYTDGIAAYYVFTKRDEAGHDALFEQALKDLDRAAYYGRGRTQVAARRADVLQRRGGDLAAVVAERRRDVKLTPLDPGRWRELTTALYDEGSCKALPAFRTYAAVCRQTASCRVDHYFENVIHEGGKIDQCFGLPPQEPGEPRQSTREDAVRLSPFEREFPICAATLRTKPPAEVIEICREKAEGGNLDAQYELYRLYSLGLLVERDVEQAMAWLSRAAKAGHGRSLTRFAYIYLYGLHGHKIDFERARRYFERGMAIGHPDAFVGMSRALYHGQNVAPDRKRARALLDRAITLGSQEARRNLQRYFPDDEG